MTDVNNLQKHFELSCKLNKRLTQINQQLIDVTFLQNAPSSTKALVCINQLSFDKAKKRKSWGVFDALFFSFPVTFFTPSFNIC